MDYERMEKKEWFLLFRYPAPVDMEYFLEKQAEEGYMLQPIGMEGPLYYKFAECKNCKCKFMVDVSNLPKAMYMETLLNKGWEYMGSSGNCYIWKQEYSDERPQDMSDSFCKSKHCRNGGILFLLISLLILAIAIVSMWAFGMEIKTNAEVKHIAYIFMAIIDLVVSVLGLIVAKRFFSGIEGD